MPDQTYRLHSNAWNNGECEKQTSFENALKIPYKFSEWSWALIVYTLALLSTQMMIRGEDGNNDVGSEISNRNSTKTLQAQRNRNLNFEKHLLIFTRKIFLSYFLHGWSFSSCTNNSATSLPTNIGTHWQKVKQKMAENETRKSNKKKRDNEKWDGNEEKKHIKRTNTEKNEIECATSNDNDEMSKTMTTWCQTTCSISFDSVNITSIA